MNLWILKSLKKWIPKLDKIVTVEEKNLAGWFGSYILEFISDKMPEQLNSRLRWQDRKWAVYKAYERPGNPIEIRNF